METLFPGSSSATSDTNDALCYKAKFKSLDVLSHYAQQNSPGMMSGLSFVCSENTDPFEYWYKPKTIMKVKSNTLH